MVALAGDGGADTNASSGQGHHGCMGGVVLSYKLKGFWNLNGLRLRAFARRAGAAKRPDIFTLSMSARELYPARAPWMDGNRMTPPKVRVYEVDL